jgi:anti-sigma factor RsiW
MRLRRPGLSCQELVELVTDYHEGALPWRTRRRFQAHIAGCDGCTAYLEQMRETIRVTGRIEPESLPPQARDELLEAFRGWAQARPA